MRIVRLASLAVLVAAVAGCQVRPLEETASAASNCTQCHGGAVDGTGAPPFDLNGQTDSPFVGAHQAHLSRGVACETCHVVPGDTNDPGHLGPRPAEVTFGPAAQQRGATPGPYDPATHTCSNVSCHGANLRDGDPRTFPSIRWDLAGGLDCTSCHGYPPVSVQPHSPTTLDCNICHAGTVAADQSILPGGNHMNGRIDAEVGTCTLCHGDANRAANRAAPPVDTQGRTAPTERGVGAHQVHLSGQNISDGVGCADCHAVPTDFEHVNGEVEVVTRRPFGEVQGTFDPATGTCSSTYCHGNLTRNGRPDANSPSWTETSGQNSCSGCHASQLSAQSRTDRHSVASHLLVGCAFCHPMSAPSTGLPALDTHVNGRVDVLPPAGYDAETHRCNSCHLPSVGPWY